MDTQYLDELLFRYITVYIPPRHTEKVGMPPTRAVIYQIRAGAFFC